MKSLLFLLLITVFSSTAFAQKDSSQVGSDRTLYTNYILLQNFLIKEKKDPGVFSTNIKPRWNSRLYQQQYQQLLAINKQKEFYPELIFNNRYVSHSMPYRYGSQNYMWVATERKYKNVGQQVASDVAGSVIDELLNSKKQRFSSRNKKGYYTPVGLRY
ncbi:hypothetical protein BH11BAC4_BH11BAC4_19030 [soil metagenome]